MGLGKGETGRGERVRKRNGKEKLLQCECWCAQGLHAPWVAGGAYNVVRV